MQEKVADQEKPEGSLHPEWLEVLGEEFNKPYMQKLRAFLQHEKQLGKDIYPAGKDIFQAFNQSPFSQVRVVIIGQDPYHGPGQAHGLCFSVRPGVSPPPSLKNIYREMLTDLGLSAPEHGYLESWAKQGVLLLNAVLTVEQGKAGAHQNRGWELFTDQAISALNQHREHLVFILWGAYAQKKGAHLDDSRHLVLKAPHPSPLSAHRGFLGSRPFSQTNRYLLSHGQKAVQWQLPDLPAQAIQQAKAAPAVSHPQ